MLEKNHRRSYQAQGTQFAATHWSVVLAAGKSTSAQQKQALETLCQSYWFPLYAFLRRRGYNTHQAEDYRGQFINNPRGWLIYREGRKIWSCRQ
jgi:hypothetical protein